MPFVSCVAQSQSESLPEDATGAFPAIDRMLEADGLYAEQAKRHAAKLKEAKKYKAEATGSPGFQLRLLSRLLGSRSVVPVREVRGPCTTGNRWRMHLHGS